MSEHSSETDGPCPSEVSCAQELSSSGKSNAWLHFDISLHFTTVGWGGVSLVVGTLPIILLHDLIEVSSCIFSALILQFL